MARIIDSDFVIVGGGLAGSVIAARLAAARPSARITLLEAGEDESGNPLTQNALACFDTHFSPLDWAYHTVPQRHLVKRQCYAPAGKALGGGSTINYGMWTRGSRADYDAWADLVGDRRWSYDGLLKYFRRTEAHSTRANGDAVGYPRGQDGPIVTRTVSESSTARVYGLRSPLQQAWNDIGVQTIMDANAGDSIGVSQLEENWVEGKRQAAPDSYGIRRHSNIKIVTGQLVRRVILAQDGNLRKLRATGVETSGGEIYSASKEVIVTCGAYRSPQLLLLSGIGPFEDLKEFDIPQKLDLPVGRNFHDHLVLYQYWRIAEPSRGLSMGNPLWVDPAYQFGLPCDWVCWTPGAGVEAMSSALKKDEESDHLPVGHASMHKWAKDTIGNGRAHIETIMAYAPAGAPLLGMTLPMDATHVATLTAGMLPTSRGTIKLASLDPAYPPAIDPNYYASEMDRVTMRHAVRQTRQVVLSMKNADGSPVFAGETVPAPAVPQFHVVSTDEEIDHRIQSFGTSMYHAGGGAALGEVVDAECRVFGVHGLRVADASVMPAPIAAHYQVAVYAIAEQVAEMIASNYP